jgi:hypothetical protein
MVLNISYTISILCSCFFPFAMMNSVEPNLAKRWTCLIIGCKKGLYILTYSIPTNAKSEIQFWACNCAWWIHPSYHVLLFNIEGNLKFNSDKKLVNKTKSSWMLNMSENTSNQKKWWFNDTKNQHARTFIYFQMLQLDSLCVNGVNGILTRVFFFPQFCKVGGLAIIHKRI